MKRKLLNFIVLLSIIFTAACLSAESDRTTILLTPDNTVNLRGEVNDESADAAARAVLLMDAKRKDSSIIYLVIDSPGGSVTAGESLIEAVKTVQNLKTITLSAASMASAIVQALEGERLIVESGMQMYHRAQGQVKGYFEDGKVESRLAFYKSLIRGMEQRNADRMKMPLKDYKEKIRNEWWLTAHDSIAARAADRIVNIKCSAELLGMYEITVLNMIIFQIPIKQSACPLIKTGEMEKPKE